LSPARLGELAHAAATRPWSARDLGRELMTRDGLTPFQVNYLLQGRGRDLVLGGYALLERLGQGGMGQVFKARHRKMNRVAALKVIRKDRVRGSDAVRRFQRELRVAAQLSHPHIVEAYDAGEDSGTYFFVMEYVEGKSLGDLVKEKGPLPVALACEYVRQAALGLQHAAERGLVHRDIKPSNLLLTARGDDAPGSPGTIKLLDLGLALVRSSSEEDQSTLTTTGMVLGTPDFMAPEQSLDSHSVDGRADLYSLGCTLYYLLTGRVPFPEGSVGWKLLRHHTEQPRPVEELRPEVSPALAAVVRRLMAKQPENRFQTPAELAEVLANGPPAAYTPPAAPVEAITAAPPDLPPAAPPEPAATAPPVDADPFGSISAEVPTPKPRAGERRRWWLLNLVGAAVLVALGALLLVVLRLAGVIGSRPEGSGGPATVLGQLRARADDPAADRDALWRDLAEFRYKEAGTPSAFEAAALLPKVPSPMDGLDAGKASGDEFADGPPRDLAALLGSHRGRHGRPVHHLAASPRGLLATGSVEGGGARVWDAATLRPRDVLGGASLVGAIAFDRDGDQLAVAPNTSTILLWRWRSGYFVERAPITARIPVGVLAFSGDGKLLAAAGNDKVVRVWDLAPEPPVLRAESPAQSTAVWSLAFAPDGKWLASGQGEGVICVWDVTAAPLREVEGLRIIEPKAAYTALAFAPAGHELAPAGGALLAAGASDGKLQLWKLGEGAARVRSDRALKPPGTLYSLAFSPDGWSLLSASGDGAVRLWDLKPLKDPTWPYPKLVAECGLPAAARGAAFVEKGKAIAAAGADGALRLLDVVGRELQERAPRPGHALAVRAVGITPDATGLRTVAADGGLRSWELRDGQYDPMPPPASWRAPVPARQVVFGPDGKTVAVASVTTVVDLWPGDDTPAVTVTDHTRYVSCLGISADGKVLASGDDEGVVRLRSATTGKLARVLGPRRGPILSVAFAPDGQALAVGDARGVTFWDTASGAELPDALTGGARCLAYTPDGKRLACGVGPAVVIHEVPKGESVVKLEGQHTGNVFALAVAPDGRSLISLGEDGQAVVWDLTAPGTRRAWLRAALGPAPTCCGFAPDGRHVVLGNEDGSAHVLRLSPPARARRP
jgi:serine/threonine-protein kinase